MHYLSSFDGGMSVDAAHGESGIAEAAALLAFYAIQSLEFTENGAINKTHSVSGSSVGKNTLLMREVRGECPDSFKLTERPQITAI